MKILKDAFDGRQHMLRTGFELLHLRDSLSPNVAEHSHDYYELYMFNTGSKTAYCVEGNTYALESSDIIVVNRLDAHRPIVTDDAVYDRIVMWITPAYLDSLSSPETDLRACFEAAAGPKGLHLLRLNREAVVRVKNTVLKLEKAYFGQNFGNDLMLKSHLCELLVLINRASMDIADEVIEDDVGGNVIVDAAIKYIGENIAEDLSLDSISRNLFVSKFHLLREFKRCVGYTVHQYVVARRLLLAAAILSEESISISEVCARCGFSDYSNFIRTFTKYYGISPSQFSRKAKFLVEKSVHAEQSNRFVI